jgi:transcriptional regulator with XRE-family HTH domain
MLEQNFQILGNRLRDLRMGRNLSAAQVAEEALGYGGGSHVAVTRLERGILKHPRRDHLAALAQYFEVPFEDLVPAETMKALQASEESTKPAQTVPKAKAVPSKAAPSPKTLAGRVHQMRQAAQLSVPEFAKELSALGAVILGLDVEAWESGEREPNNLQLHVLARFGNKPLEWLQQGGAARHTVAA